MSGFDAPYVPGWDCHGMPIEVQIEKKHGKNLPTQETQRLCLNGLYRINNETAKDALARIYGDEAQDERWRTLSAEYLRRAAREDQRITPATAKIIAEMGGQ